MSRDEQTDYLLQMVQRLTTVGIPYMVTGSYATNIHGRPRATNDVDIVIDPTAEQLDSLFELLGEHEYASRDTAAAALRNKSMFNVINTESGWKVDLIVRKDRSYSLEEFSRRITVDSMGTRICICTAEDSILSKLEWGKRSASERQFQDALAVAALRWENLDLSYLKKWADELSVRGQLDSILQRVEETHSADS